MMFLVVS